MARALPLHSSSFESPRALLGLALLAALAWAGLATAERVGVDELEASSTKIPKGEDRPLTLGRVERAAGPPGSGAVAPALRAGDDRRDGDLLPLQIPSGGAQAARLMMLLHGVAFCVAQIVRR